MAKTTRNVVAAVMAVVGITGAVRADEPVTGSVAQAARVSRVRSDSPVILAAIRSGVERSATFRGLVGAIDASDGIVYVQEGKCGHGVRACLALSVTKAGPSRLLRIIVDTGKNDVELIGSIGHELRHAMEVLEEASVDSGAAIYLLYQRIGAPSGDRFETEAAILAGDIIRGEVSK